MIEIKDLAQTFKNDKADDLETIVDSLLENETIRNFVYESGCDKNTVVSSIPVLLDLKSDEFINDDGKKESKRYRGFYPILLIDKGKIKVEYKRINKDYQSKIKIFNMPSSTGVESFDDFDLTTNERKVAYQYARRFINNFKTNNQIKGMYISGDFRSGKTYLALCIARELAEMGYTVNEMYYPELSTLLKSSMYGETDETFYQLIEELKGCDLLVLDDFGGEACNPTVRDEALGVILNYRMNKNKPVIFTSNIRVKDLANTSLRKDGSEVEMIKALRIVERIKELTEEFNVTGRYKERSMDSYEN